MSAQTVKQATETVSKDLQLINWLRQQQDDVAMAAASHLKPSTIVRVAQGALRKDPKLMAAAIANPQSLIHCLLDAARLGHEAGTDQYWLIPFAQEVTGIEGYKGVIERMFRAGGVSTVHAEVVRQRDAYRSLGSRTPPVHEYDDFADDDERGPLRGVYAYAIMADGSCSQVIRMGKAEVMKHKAMSKGSDRSDSPWQKWEPAMWKKGPLNALEPYVPTSSEWLMTRAQASATAQGRAVVAPGWAPPLPAAAAPLQLVPGVVEPEPEPERQLEPQRPAQQARRPRPENVPPAREQDLPPASSEPPREPAGGAPRASKGQVGVIRQHFSRLYPGDVELPAERLERLDQTARLAGMGATITSTSELSPDEAARVIRALDKVRDAAALEALLSDGTAPGE